MATIKIFDETDGKEYELLFTLRTIKQMGANGFNINIVADNPIIGIPQLFAGAFLAKHRTISQDKVDSIFEQIEDKEGFVNALCDLYNAPVDKLFGEPDENAKKARWEVVK